MANEMNPQISAWTSEFGREYTERNNFTVQSMDSLYMDRYGSTRTAMNHEFLDGIDRTIRILEVGCNIGTQLSFLGQMGFQNLSGIDVQESAVELARAHLPSAELLVSPGQELPFPDDYFDLVFTSGVLIHIAPKELGTVMQEIHRCSRKLIWGFEYYSENQAAIPYRGNEGLLWKNDFARMYCEQFPDLSVVLKKNFPYVGEDIVDSMFLLQKP